MSKEFIEGNIIEKEYFEDLNKIKKTIRINQNKAMVVVNTSMIINYYEIGVIINQRKTWGNKYIERLSVDLKEYGEGYSTSNLKRMSQLAANFDRFEIGAQPVLQLGWGHLILIMQKSHSHEEMLWYINETYKNKWSRTILGNKIKMKSYELRLIEKHDNSIISNENPLIDEMFNSKLAITFIDKNKITTEKDLEKELINNITKFILELGKGFAFVGNQYKLEIPNHEYYPDLLFYNYILHSFVVIDLKLTEFKPEYLGKMMFYVNIANDTLKGENDNPSIGLILCKEADNIVMKYSFGSTITPIKVAEYKFIEELPEYLGKRLKAISSLKKQ